MSILVTGGNGYIGSHMCQLLHNLGQDFIAIDNFSTSPPHTVHNYCEVIRCDKADREHITKLITEYGITKVFHFADYALVGESMQNPVLYMEENISKNIDFFEACFSSGVKSMVYSSSCAVYGEHKELIHEKTDKKPINPYGKSKLVSEKLLTFYSDKYNVDVVCLRYFNVVGNCPDSKLGENHDPETHIIPNLIKAQLNGNTFKIFGDNYATKDGTCVRDYIHVLDLVNLHVKAMKYLETNPGWFSFNLGSGMGSSIKEVILMVKEHGDLSVEVYPARAGDPASLVADNSKAVKELALELQYTIKDAIKHCFDFKKGLLK